MKRQNIIFLLLFGIIITSCRKPTDPESITNPVGAAGYKVVKKFQTPGYAQDVIKKDNYLYLAQGEGGLLILDISDLDNPIILVSDLENARGYSRKIAMKDSVVYLAAGTYGVTSIRVTNPSEPYMLSYNNDPKPAKNITVFGNYLFTCKSEEGASISLLDNNLVPNERGKIGPQGYVQDIVISADTNYAFTACGEMGLSICNIKGFIEQQGYGSYLATANCNVPGYAEAILLDEENSIAYTACGTAGLQVVDYSDTTDLKIIGSVDAGGYAKDLYHDKNKSIIYMTAELSGLQIIDVKNPSSPKLIGEIDTEFALGLTVDENYIYIADEDEGLIIISIP